MNRNATCLMSDVGGLRVTASVSLLTSAFRLLVGRLLQQIIIEFNDSVAEGEAFLLYGFVDLTHTVRSHLEKKRARVYEDSLSHYMLL